MFSTLTLTNTGTIFILASKQGFPGFNSNLIVFMFRVVAVVL